MRNILKKILLPLFLLSTVISVGFSAWNINGSKFEFNKVTNVTNLKKVAYLESDTNTYYTSIEKAVDFANSKGSSQKVYVIPGTTYTITESFTINNGVSLIFPYEGTSYTQTGTDATKIENSGGTTSDANHFAKEDERTTLITLSENTTITLEAGSVFRIGGVTGCNAQSYSGQTTGKYTELKMEAGSSIVCNGGTLDVCGGYITESVENNDSERSEIFINSGTLNVPFVIYDFKGGSITLGLINSNKVCPFSIFDFVNIQVYTEIQKGSYFYGKAKIAMRDSFVYTTVNIINPDNEKNSLFILKDNGSIAFKYEKINDERFPAVEKSNASDILPNDQNYTMFFISGGCSFGEITISITYMGIPKTINSANFFLPFSYKMRVFVNSGANVTINAKLKFMPGSSVTIEEGANVSIQAPVVFYEGEFKDVQAYAPYPSGKPSAQVEVGGNLTVGTNGSFGAVMQDGSVGAPVIAISDNATLSYQSTVLSATTYEGNGTNPSGLGALSTASGTIEITRYAACYNISKDDTGGALINGNQKVLSSKPIYKSINIGNNYYWTLASSYTINFKTNDGTSIISSLTKTGAEKLTTPSSVSDGNLLGWATAANATKVAYNMNQVLYVYDLALNGNLNLYAVLEGTQATPSKLTISYSNSYDNPDTLSYSIECKDKGYYKESSEAIEISGTFNVGDEIVYKPISGVDNDKTTFTGFVNNEPTLTNGAYTLTIANAECKIAITGSGTNNSGGGCVIPGTMITLADGSQKAVENILPGDELLVINHETGEYDVSPVIFNDSEPLGMYDVTYLRFSDGSEVGISYEHGFFDRTLNKYVYITNSNGEEYIGHEFYTENGYVTLDEVETVQEETRLYSPVTAWHLNYFTNGVLSMPGGIEGLFNIFEYEQDSLKYDEFLMQQDIDTYGLFTYDDFKDYCSYEFYSAFPAPYLKVSIGKGYITKEEIIRLIERYSKLV